MVYVIKKNGKRVTLKDGSMFITYEMARRAVRAAIRRAVRKGKAVRQGMWDGVSRNPTGLRAYGYEIVKA